MALIPIIQYGTSVLRKEASPVEVIDDRIRILAADMLETMHRVNALGLAAPQIGEAVALFVVNGPAAYEDEEPVHKDMVVINPVIKKKQGSHSMEEGCLSIPGIRLDISRAEEVELEYTTLDGGRRNLEADGLAAKVFQHEMDHLNGVMIVDHVGTLKRQMIKKQLKELEQGAQGEGEEG